MSITSAELIAYGAANKPQDDVSADGGAIDATYRPVFTQLGANDTLDYVSSNNADMMNITAEGRDPTGALVFETVALNGTTTVHGVQVFERVLKVSLASAAAGTVTVTAHTAAITVGTIPPGEIGFYALFIGSFSSSVEEIRYEKIFWKNTDGSLTLTSSQVTLTADPESVINIGLAAAVNDSVSVANRFTAPAGVTFVGVGVAQNVPGGGNLAAGSAIGTWIKQDLPIAHAAFKDTFTTQLSGLTT